MEVIGNIQIHRHNSENTYCLVNGYRMDNAYMYLHMYCTLYSANVTNNVYRY